MDYQSIMGELSPQEQIRRMLAGDITPYSPVDEPQISQTATSKPTLDLNRDMTTPAPQTPNATNTALVDSTNDILQRKADDHNANAMAMLQQALNSQAEISPSQALAAGILAIVPTLGGFVAGQNIGTPKLSPHLRLSPDELMKLQDVGPKLGLQTGAAAAGQYLGGINQNFEKNKEVLKSQAEMEAKQADKYQTSANAVQAHRLNKEADVAIEARSPLGAYKLTGSNAAQKLLDDRPEFVPIFAKYSRDPASLTPQEHQLIDPYLPTLIGGTVPEQRAAALQSFANVREQALKANVKGGYMELRAGEPNSPYQPPSGQSISDIYDNPNLALNRNEGIDLKRTEVTITNALNQMAIGKDAIRKYGLLATQVNKDPKELEKLGEAVQQSASGAVQQMTAMAELAGNLYAKGAISEGKMALIQDLAAPALRLGELLQLGEFRKTLLTDPQTAYGMINDIDREVRQKFGTMVEVMSGLKYTGDIAGGPIVPHSPAGPFSPGQPLEAASGTGDPIANLKAQYQAGKLSREQYLQKLNSL